MSLRDQLDNISPRERKLLSLLGVVFAVIVLLGLPGYVYADLLSTRSHNDAIREQLAQIDKMGPLLSKRRAQREAQDRRYANPAPRLGPFIEGAANEHGLEVPESKRLSEVEHGGFTERATQVKMRKVGLEALVGMLEQIERSGYPVAITKLEITNRAPPPDTYDVTLAVSAYDKEGAQEAAAAAASASAAASTPRPSTSDPASGKAPAKSLKLPRPGTDVVPLSPPKPRKPKPRGKVSDDATGKAGP